MKLVDFRRGFRTSVQNMLLGHFLGLFLVRGRNQHLLTPSHIFFYPYPHIPHYIPKSSLLETLNFQDSTFGLEALPLTQCSFSLFLGSWIRVPLSWFVDLTLPLLSLAGRRKALSPQLCAMCPVPDDVHGRRGDVPER